MFKQMLTLFRGQVHEAAEQMAAREVLVILDQQIRDADAAIGQARRALAVATAEDRLEAGRIASIGQRIEGLEDRARAALAGGSQALAFAAAQAIANLEIDRQASSEARQGFAAEIARLRESFGAAERRFADLHRGRRLARVGHAVQQAALRGGPEDRLGAAEATLAALRGQQALHAQTDACLQEISAGSIEERLNEAGFGPALPNAASVLARLQQRVIAQS